MAQGLELAPSMGKFSTLFGWRWQWLPTSVEGWLGRVYHFVSLEILNSHLCNTVRDYTRIKIEQEIIFPWLLTSLSELDDKSNFCKEEFPRKSSSSLLSAKILFFDKRSSWRFSSWTSVPSFVDDKPLCERSNLIKFWEWKIGMHIRDTRSNTLQVCELKYLQGKKMTNFSIILKEWQALLQLKTPPSLLQPFTHSSSMFVPVCCEKVLPICDCTNKTRGMAISTDTLQGTG